MEDNPIIQCSIHYFLETLWGYKDRSVISRKDFNEAEIYKQLKALPRDTYCHLEESDDNNLVVVWRLKDWQSHYRKIAQDKQQAEVRVTEWNNKKETKSYLCDLIVKKMGELMRGPMSENFADEIIKTKNTAAVLMLGGDPSKIKW